jgi:hypothetical protein
VFATGEVPDAGQSARVFRHLLALVPLEQGTPSDEVIRLRRALRQLAPEFFRYYMSTLASGRRPS